ncbi:unnamed protein product [Brachionus calyciflorus]|uniref:Uncharacterized protein n=1 Tax=Brachionus calyciflorus TaxID=104777 RepID=A0A813VD65_9BILA|nr:unnamed protein product [Brachionus calyciflorus]
MLKKIYIILGIFLSEKVISDFIVSPNWYILTGNYSNTLNFCLNSTQGLYITSSENDYLELIYSQNFINYAYPGMKIWLNSVYVAAKYYWMSSNKEIVEFPCFTNSVVLMNTRAILGLNIGVYISVLSVNPYSVRLEADTNDNKFNRLCKNKFNFVSINSSKYCCSQINGLKENCSNTTSSAATKSLNFPTTAINEKNLATSKFETSHKTSELSITSTDNQFFERTTEKSLKITTDSLIEKASSIGIYDENIPTDNSKYNATDQTEENLNYKNFTTESKFEYSFDEWSDWKDCELEKFYNNNSTKIKIDCSLVYSNEDITTLTERIQFLKRNKSTEIRKNTIRSLDKITAEFASARQIGRCLTIAAILSLVFVAFYLVFLDLSNFNINGPKINTLKEWLKNLYLYMKIMYNLENNNFKIKPMETEDLEIISKAKINLIVDKKIIKIQKNFFQKNSN